MSNSLNRISLELVDLEINVKCESNQNRKIKPKSILDLMPANHKIVKNKKKSELTIRTHQYKTIDKNKVKKRLSQQKDSTEENIQKLLLLSSNRIDINSADKLFNRAVKKRPVLRDKKPEEEERTAFTDEDFKNFEKEYMKN